MTDKQIMIDGIDVSGCLFYLINFEEDYDVKIKHYCSKWHNSCESNNNSNCYYKQLKRKEQECEELKKELESTKGLVTVGNRQLVEALLELQKLYNKFEGKSLIETRTPNDRI